MAHVVLDHEFFSGEASKWTPVSELVALVVARALMSMWAMTIDVELNVRIELRANIGPLLTPVIIFIICHIQELPAPIPISWTSYSWSYNEYLLASTTALISSLSRLLVILLLVFYSPSFQIFPFPFVP